MKAGQKVLKSRVRGERLGGEGKTMGLAGVMEGGEIPAAGTDTEDGSGGERRGVGVEGLGHGKKGRD